MLDFGQNDPSAVTTGPALGVPFANAVASNVQANVSQLVGLGARNFLLFGGSDFNRVLAQFGLNLVGVNGVNIASPAYQTFYSALQTAVPNAVAQVINPPVNVYYLDTNTLFRRVLDNPGQFGFLPGDCAVIASCRTSNSLAVQNQYAFYQFHPTDALSAIIARYFNVILNGPSTVVPQADIGKAVERTFSIRSACLKSANRRLRSHPGPKLMHAREKFHRRVSEDLDILFHPRGNGPPGLA
jgi:phospholipase/lecithinase/hemolysin